MAVRKPLVLNGGQIEQLQPGDTLDATVSEVDLITLTNGGGGAAVICSAAYVSAAGTFQPARANASGTTRVIGLVKSTSVAAAASGSIQTDGVFTATTTQWDGVTGGSGGLTAGAVYYLSEATAGNLTATAPTSGFNLPVGIALSTTELEISIGEPIKL